MDAQTGDLPKTGASPAAKRRFFMIIATVGVFLYVGIAFSVDAPRFLGAMGRLGWGGAASVAALSLASFMFRFQRWNMYVRRLGHRVPWAHHLLIYFSGFAFTLSPGKAGEAVRSMYLREYGVSYAESLAAFFVERMLDVLAMGLLAALVLADHPTYRALIVGIVALVTCIIIAVSRAQFPGYLDSIAAKRAGRTARLFSGAAKLLRSTSRLFHVWPLIYGIVLGMVAWGALGIGVYATAVLAGNAAIFLPGGLGGTEIVLIALLRESGASLQSAVIAALLCILSSLWFGVLVGVLAAWLTEMTEARSNLKAGAPTV
jgi:uncharacterized membrane protein YbhN (UPF0104 family)